MNQLIVRLDEAIASAEDRERCAELVARKVCALARLGRSDAATELLTSLRNQFGDWSNGRTHVWIMVAEGLVNWYRDLSSLALDRIVRAQALSAAMRYDEVLAISSAWKAHIEFEMSNFDSMFLSLRTARKAASVENNDANARIAIVICNSMACCGDWAGAQEWFGRGRQFALLDGDRAGIEALQYNRAALLITWIRVEQFGGRGSPEALAAARRELESALNFQALTGVGALANHLALCSARLLGLEGKHDNARAALEALRSQTPFASYHFNSSLLDLEVAYSNFKVNLIDVAIAAVSRLDFSAFGDLDIDDRFVVAAMLSEMSQVDSRFGDSNQLALTKSDLQFAYANSRSALRLGIQDLLAPSVA